MKQRELGEQLFNVGNGDKYNNDVEGGGNNTPSDISQTNN